MGAAKRDLNNLLEWLDRGYVLVDGSGINGAKYDFLHDEGWDVAAVYRNELETSKKKKHPIPDSIKKARNPIEEEK